MYKILLKRIFVTIEQQTAGWQNQVHVIRNAYLWIYNVRAMNVCVLNICSGKHPSIKITHKKAKAITCALPKQTNHPWQHLKSSD